MNTKKLFSLLSAIFLCCLIIFLYQNRKENVETPVSIEPQVGEASEKKPTPVKERFTIVKMLDLSDSSKADVVDADGNELMIGALYLQSKSDLKLHLIPDTLSIYQEADYALAIDNKEEGSIKVRGNDGFFFIQGLILLPEVGKEIILDSLDHYQMVMNY